MKVADITPRDSTEGHYRHKGLAWLGAAKILHENDTAHLMGPFYYMVSHAFELFTKAFLLWRGVSHKELRSRDFGHNISALVHRAKELGLQIEDEYIPLIETMENLNKDHMQRYPMIGFFTIGQLGYVEPNHIINWVQKYYDKIYGIISSEKNRFLIADQKCLQ